MGSWPIRFARVLPIVACTLFACGDGFVVEVADGGADPRQDGSSPNEDASPARDRCDPPSALCASGCPMPWLLATAQDLDGAGRCGGHVFRYSLSEAGVCSCSSYETTGDNHPTTVSYIPGGTVLVGTLENAFTFGGGRMVRYLGGDIGVDSFIVEGETPGSAPVGVLLAGSYGFGTSKRQLVFGVDGSFVELEHDPLRTISSDTATQNPANRRGYRSADVNRPSVDRFFWEGGVDALMHFAGGQDGPIEAFYANGLHRTVIVHRDGVRHVANAARTLNNSPASVACSGAAYEGCQYRAAAPDPTSANHVYVACEQPVDERWASRIARLDVRDDSCVDLLPFEHWRRIRITDLSVGLEDYWAP